MKDSVGFGGAQEGAGRPRKPRAVDVIRERIEADLDRWLKPLEQAIEADKVVLVWNGEGMDIEIMPDFALRLKAMAEAFDRAYGRPRQALEHSGPGGEAIPVEHEVDIADPESRELIGELLRRRARTRAK